MTYQILITGSTGNVGTEIVRELNRKQISIKAAVTNNKSASQSKSKNKTVVLDFENPKTFKGALSGISTVFLMRPPQMGNPKQLYPFIDACKNSGVQHIVFLSLLGIQYNPFAPHGYIEKHIKKSGISYTLLRPSFFMQNLSTTHVVDIRDNDEVFVPAGKGKTSFIDARDIAAVAAVTLSEAGHTNKAYDLTGSEALSYYDVAKILSGVLGRPIVYSNPPTKEFEKRMIGRGLDADYVSIMNKIYLVNKLGLAGKVTNTVQDILGRPAIAFTKFANDNKEIFTRLSK